MITENHKYTVECDWCGSEMQWPTKAKILKNYHIYEDITDGTVAHFCCEGCARNYINTKKKGLTFKRVTNLKDFNIHGSNADIVTVDEHKKYNKTPNLYVY